MQIPVNPSVPKPPLELVSIRLYSTGARGKVYTKKFYKSMNHNFGVEMVIRNNTAVTQAVRMAGRVYNSEGNEVLKWSGGKFHYNINANTSQVYNFFARESSFSSMAAGKYKIQFWINNTKVQREFFEISYK